MFLYQPEDGFLFNSDAHFLYDFISNFNLHGNVLDIGSGCGILGLLSARDFRIDLTMIDIQEQNRRISRENARVNSVRAKVICDDFLKHSFDEKFDFIISNPPYYHKGVGKSENISKKISKSGEYLDFEAMVSKINSIIKPKGSFIFCYDAKQLPFILQTLLEKKLLPEAMRFVHGTETKAANLVMIRAKKGSKALCKVFPPLINFINGDISPEVKSIYQKTRTYSIKCKVT